MNKVALIVALFTVVIFGGCKKSPSSNNNTTINSVNDIKVPSGFKWESSHSVSFSVAITDTRFGTAAHLISIYNGDPNAGGSLLTQGSATTATPFAVNLYVPNQLSQVYVVKTSPDNSRIINTASVAGTSASLSFGATDPTANQRRAYGSGNRTTSDCSSGCTSTITTSTNNVNVNNGDMICITGNNITVNFSSINGGTVRVCGTNVTLQNMSLNGSSTLLITSSGSAVMSSLNFNSSTATLQNDGTLTIAGSVSDNGIFTNNGTYSNSGDFNINSSAGAFTNGGSMTVSGNFNNNGPVSAVNNSSIIVTGAFQENSGSAAFINNCSLRINGNYNQNAQVKNYSFIKVGGTCTLNASTELDLYNTAMLETNAIILNSMIKGFGSTSLVKVTGSVTVNSGGGVNGAVQVSSTNTFGTGYLSGGAALGSTLYVPVSGCNSDGNGSTTPPDADGDGIADNLDAYPNDATKAYNNYYPSSTGGATVAFEDQWPAKGDYDLNDLVMGYQYQIVTNAANNVVQVIGNYTLYATGGTRQNSFAVQFPVPYSSVSGLTGGTLQSGQTNAVVVLFTNMRDEMAQWNTVPGVAQTTPKTYTVSFNVASGPSISSFGLSSYNPFIWSNPGNEVHLPGHLPTTLANQALFGTQDDNTNVSGGVYYVTKTGLPYALDVPVMPFSYPVEDTDITKAYLHFGTWAQSNGTSFTDWYSNTGSGYRNTANIYTH